MLYFPKGVTLPYFIIFLCSICGAHRDWEGIGRMLPYRVMRREGTIGNVQYCIQTL